MQQVYGFVGYHLQKLKQLECVSRSMIFYEEVVQVKDLKLRLAQKMKEKFAEGVTDKEAIALVKERKRLELLAKLKEDGGPFTCSEEVDEYLHLEKNCSKNRRRMKLEVQFARESSTCLPKTDPLFRIQIALPNKKRRDKTAEEFGVALKALLGKQNRCQSSVTIEQFRASLKKTIAD